MIQVHNLLQGSSEWHQFRADHFGASEASAMLGISPYKTRTQLLNEKKTGLVTEVSPALQRVYDKGHEVEALARPIVEKMIGEDLSPVTYSNGKLSASCDGITFMGDIVWENKQFNKADFELVKNGELPEKHWPQCQQILYCTGAGELFFTISDGTEQNTAGVWVYPDEDLQGDIVAGWDQFQADLEVHEVAEVKAAPKAQAILALPSLAIAIKGEVTLSNLPEFTEAATAYIANINTDLVTDEDFADAEANIKFCEDVESNIEVTKKSAISQTASIDELMRTLDFIKAQVRDKRLELAGKVKTEKENRKISILDKAKLALAEHFISLSAEVKPIQLINVQADFASAIKGKKRFDNMQDAVNAVLVNAKIELDAQAKDIRAKKAWLKENADGYQMLFADIQTIIHKPMDDLQVLVRSRILDHQRLEAEREAAIKEQAEADAKAKLEAGAKQSAIAREQAAAAIAQEPVNNVINEADFNKTFEATKQPSAKEIITLVASTYQVTPQKAKQWLIDAFAAHEVKVAA